MRRYRAYYDVTVMTNEDMMNPGVPLRWNHHNGALNILS